ncbi:MAG: sulfotransferase [Methylococcales bacterium]
MTTIKTSSGLTITADNISFFPTFFLIGAPRCGTTALSKYLSRNSQICFSKPKEPHFFTILLKMLGKVDIERDYIQRFFFHKTDEHLACGEGSVSYLYSDEALDVILQLKPDAQFIVNVRNPLEMIYSYHARLLKLVEEDEQDFRVAWDLQDTRKQGKKIPKGSHDADLFQYQEIGSQGKYLERLFERVGRERVHVVVFDDFTANTLAEYKKVLNYLGVEYDGRTDFPRKGKHETVRFRFLQRLLKRPPRRVANFLLTLQQQQKRKQKGKKNWLMRIRKMLIVKNRVRAQRTPMDESMREVLIEAFTDDVKKLGNLLNRDLSHWMT